MGVAQETAGPKGHYTEGADLIDQLLDVIRLETERAESLQGFQIVHSLGGGTGSGMGTLLVCRLREEFPDKMLWTWSLTETSIDDCVVRPYNNMLAMQYLIENTDAVVYIDDDASYKACFNNRISKPTYRHLNTITANIMSNVTCSMRLDSSEFTSLRKISTNLVPFPRQHFLTVGTAPLNSRIYRKYWRTTR
jgi:tubulin beta